MKKLIFLKLALCTFLFAACEKETFDDPFKIDGITMENYPKVDGSTTTIGLQNLIACKLLGFQYDWFDVVYFPDGAYAICPVQAPPDRYWECVKSSKTHDSFINLIDRNVDFTLTARKMSDSEKAYADAAGVTLIETPVALDAFIFITNNENPVNALTTKQIQDIYTGKVTNWWEVDGKDAAIHPYRRNEDSGSQELMESLVMQDLEMMDLPNENNIFSMMGAYHELEHNVDGLCYTVYYYNKFMVRDKKVKAISVDGVFPDKTTLTNRTYPYTEPVYAVIRSDLGRNSMAYKIYELLLSEAGRSVIVESGYVPY